MAPLGDAAEPLKTYRDGSSTTPEQEDASSGFMSLVPSGAAGRWPRWPPQHGEPRRAANELDMRSWSLEATPPARRCSCTPIIHRSPMSTEHLLGSRFGGVAARDLKACMTSPRDPEPRRAVCAAGPGAGRVHGLPLRPLWCPSTATSSRACMAAVATLNFRDAQGAEVSWQPEASLLVRGGPRHAG